jgi:hypothetical protein
VGAERIVDRPWPSGAGDTEPELRRVPEGTVHAVDSSTGRPVCDAAGPLLVLETSWEDKWTLSSVDGPFACAVCTFRLWAAEKPRDGIYTGLEFNLEGAVGLPEAIERVDVLVEQLEERSLS